MRNQKESKLGNVASKSPQHSPSKRTVPFGKTDVDVKLVMLVLVVAAVLVFVIIALIGVTALTASVIVVGVVVAVEVVMIGAYAAIMLSSSLAFATASHDAARAVVLLVAIAMP